MPDLAMCNGIGCEMKEICYRYRATPNEFRQIYFTESPNNGLECDYYLKFEL